MFLVVDRVPFDFQVLTVMLSVAEADKPDWAFGLIHEMTVKELFVVLVFTRDKSAGVSGLPRYGTASCRHSKRSPRDCSWPYFSCSHVLIVALLLRASCKLTAGTCVDFAELLEHFTALMPQYDVIFMQLS